MNKNTVICKICGTPFQTTDYRRKLCSVECQNENNRRIARDRNGFRYPLKFRDLKIREVVNILVTENITIEEYIDNRDYYVFRFLAYGDLYYGN
ncbi:MAG: hypothetical protein IKY90_08925 [Oscillospiraceae bacterium]|nr:hypothetical protein [Oscillospiraceae bacterium]